MKWPFAVNIFVSICLLALALAVGVYWGLQPVAALNGLRSTRPLSIQEEAEFIRSRVDHPLVPPEWISGSGLEEEMVWLRYEMMARCGLVVAISLATIYATKVLSRGRNAERAEPDGQRTTRGM